MIRQGLWKESRLARIHDVARGKMEVGHVRPQGWRRNQGPVALVR